MLDATSARVLDVAHEDERAVALVVAQLERRNAAAPLGSSTGSRERGQGSASSVGPAGKVTA